MEEKIECSEQEDEKMSRGVLQRRQGRERGVERRRTLSDEMDL